MKKFRLLSGMHYTKGSPKPVRSTDPAPFVWDERDLVEQFPNKFQEVPYTPPPGEDEEDEEDEDEPQPAPKKVLKKKKKPTAE
jgi:hypothetical protein